MAPRVRPGNAMRAVSRGGLLQGQGFPWLMACVPPPSGPTQGVLSAFLLLFVGSLALNQLPSAFPTMGSCIWLLAWIPAAPWAGQSNAAPLSTAFSAARLTHHLRLFPTTICVLLSPKMWSLDRKSTRLNSSHVAISYAVFCLKKTNH